MTARKIQPPVFIDTLLFNQLEIVLAIQIMPGFEYSVSSVVRVDFTCIFLKMQVDVLRKRGVKCEDKVLMATGTMKNMER